MGKISLNLYTQANFFLQNLDNEIILKIQVIPYKIKGSTREVKIEIPVSLKNINWVFWYTAQKAEIKYQWNKNTKNVNTKNPINFLFTQSKMLKILLFDNNIYQSFP